MKQTDSTARTMTVVAGNSISSGIGNLEQSLAQDVGALLCLDGSRFNDTSNSDKIKITFATGFTGFIRAIKLPVDF